MARRDTLDAAGGSRCPLGVCDGSGWIVAPDDTASSCECRQQRINRARTRGVSSVIPAKYRGVGFERPPVTFIEQAVVRAVRDYVNDLDSRLKAGEGLWLMGAVGTGKTTLAMIVSKAALEAGHTAAIYSLPKLLSSIRRTFDGEPGAPSHEQFFARLTSVDLLHIDDVGVEKTSPWVLEELYSLVNQRYEDQRSIVITTNLPPDELEEQIGQRTTSRLVEICGDPLWLEGEDLRYPVARAQRRGADAA